MKNAESLKFWTKSGANVIMATACADAVITRAGGCTFHDADGNEYLDLCSGQICSLVGHGHPELVRTIAEQMGQLIHTGTSFLSPPVFELSARIAHVAPGELSKSLLLSTGAEANEFALRLAKAYTGRTGVLALTRGYAGLTVATASLTNFGKGARPIVPGTGYILTPDPTECPAGRTPSDWAEELLHESLEVNKGLLDNVAAIIVEPILSAGGLIVPPEGFLKLLRGVADELGALLIADEAQTGMGRTGKWFGVEHEGIVPDILVLSKGVGGGFPLSIVVTTPAIADGALGKATQFSSHQSDPLAAAAGLAVMDIIEKEGLVKHSAEMGSYMMDQLRTLASRRPQLAHVRGRGLMVGFDVFRDPAKAKRERDAGQTVEDFCRERGVHLQSIQKNKFRILPPLVIQKPEIDRFIHVLDEALAALAAGTAKPQPPTNPYTSGFAARKTKGVASAFQWAWTNSPKAWFDKLRGKK